jgi:DNA-binding MurR/RpiR family transcriptional regulator
MNEAETFKALRGLLAELTGPMAEAARYLLAHPEDVAVHSMRSLARRAEVPPVTLVRLAQRLGLPGYGELRQGFVERVLRNSAAAQMAATRNTESARAIAAAADAGTGALAFADGFFAAEHDLLRRAFAGLSETTLDRAATSPSLTHCARRGPGSSCLMTREVRLRVRWRMPWRRMFLSPSPLPHSVG